MVPRLAYYYIGISLTTSGITEDKHIMRVKAAQRRLMQLSSIGIHIREFNMNLCVMLYRVFVRSIYEYGLHLGPLSLALKLVISRLESCFFWIVLGKVASRFGSSRLPRLRSHCRLESVGLRRIIIGYQRLSYYHDRRIAALQVPKTDPNRTQNVRSACEQLTMFVTHSSIMGMEKSIHSLSKENKAMFRKRKWNGACSSKPPTSTWNAQKTSTPGLASAESTPQTFRCQTVLWRVPSTTNIGKGTAWVEGLHGWQAPRTSASRTIVTTTESRTKYGTWYHIPYCPEYVAISLHNDVEIVLLRFPAVDNVDTINKMLWFKKKKKKNSRLHYCTLVAPSYIGCLSVCRLHDCCAA